tara:strand:- start:707 stop:1003 length:297 start_codon:yes stop_codon:yes gene_type:complete
MKLEHKDPTDIQTFLSKAYAYGRAAAVLCGQWNPKGLLKDFVVIRSFLQWAYAMRYCIHFISKVRANNTFKKFIIFWLLEWWWKVYLDGYKKQLLFIR